MADLTYSAATADMVQNGVLKIPAGFVGATGYLRYKQNGNTPPSPPLVLPVSTTNAFGFTLNTPALTSAGVFLPDGTLLKTLWSNVPYNAGTYTQQLDGTDDSGAALPNGNYKVVVQSSNVSYEPEGVIGNTSIDRFGPTIHRQFQGIHDLVIAGGYAYYGTNYTEGDIDARRKFALSDPQRIVVMPNLANGLNCRYLATDGVRVYWGGSVSFFGEQGDRSAFVFATLVSDDTAFTFSQGASHWPPYGKNIASVIDDVNDPNSIITGLAVQQAGSYLFVARAGLNSLHVLDKVSGQLVQSLTYTQPGRMQVDGNDKLWLTTSNGRVEKFTVNGDGTLTTTGVTLSSLTTPGAIAVSPDKATVAVIELSVNQVKFYSNSAGGSPTSTLGTPGGYNSDPNVVDGKLYLADNQPIVDNSFQPALAYTPTGDLYVGDAGNYRLLKFRSGAVVDAIMYLPHYYSAVVVQNDPTRVFGEYLEFQVDYSKPLLPSNGSWKLVRNWRASLPAGFYRDQTVNIFYSAVKRENGRTYALLPKTMGTTVETHLVELPATGPIRDTGMVVPPGTRMEADGTLKRFAYGAVGGAATWYTTPPAGFDGSGNPLYAAETVLEIAATTPPTDAISWGDVQPGQVTTSGVLVSYDIDGEVHDGANGPVLHGNGYHLGGRIPGSGKWLWQTEKATATTYQGGFPAPHIFDTGNGVKNPGGNVLVMGNEIFTSYKGENWKQGQTNKWNHFRPNGLAVGQFGTTVAEDGGNFIAGQAGNVTNGNAVMVDNVCYLYHNDESVLGGVARWKITGLDSVQTQIKSVSLPVRINNLPNSFINLLANLQGSATLADGSQGWAISPATPDLDSVETHYWNFEVGAHSVNAAFATDVLLRFRNNNSQTNTATKALPATSNLSSWTLRTKLNFLGLETYGSPRGGLYMDILDTAGKSIARFVPAGKPIEGGETLMLLGNSKTIASFDQIYGVGQAQPLIRRALNTDQDLLITGTANAITIQYGSFAAVTDAVFEAGAMWNAPASVRWSFYSSPGYDRLRLVDILTLEFLPVS